MWMFIVFIFIISAIISVIYLINRPWKVQDVQTQAVVNDEEPSPSPATENLPKTMTLDEMAEDSSWCNNTSTPQYIAYDLETTGLSPENCEIIEIAAVKVEYHKIVDTFHELVKPKNKIPSKITSLTGITNEMVDECRSIEEVLPDFIQFTEKLPMVAHNADFDYSFIKKHYSEIYGKQFSRRHYDTIKKYKQYYRGSGMSPDSCKLSDVVLDILGVDYWNKFLDENHRALTDATALYYIFEIIND